eukprot:SAG11_NODE_2541_length_3241_cov_4.313495_4_plen_43_part_00
MLLAILAMLVLYEEPIGIPYAVVLSVDNLGGTVLTFTPNDSH